ncbi:MFS transporter [Virgibacillus ihumii]|uniref:MFS transporter n=1 Tax=Virgibacillus ihumii TaxID=2686091 RepID=UPI001FECC73B|nr:aromatic acid/H+ symport family MFS transporter [Virgibacillus ihumii]
MNDTKKIPGITYFVVAMCWFGMFAEGYDLAIYGAVLPALLEYPEWSLSAAMAGSIGSMALIGMLIGAICVGTITDIFGRKKIMIACLTLFSIMMAFSAMAPSPEWFSLFRFIGGIGCGGIIPTASALTIEYSPNKRRSLIYAMMYSGYAFGGVFSALISIFFLDEYGWRLMFFVGATPILVVPFMIKFLPESIDFLTAKGRYSEAEQIANRYNISIKSVEENQLNKKQQGENKSSTVATLFSKHNFRATVFFWITFFLGLFMIYGLTTWLPEIMREAGYALGSSLGFLLMLNFSAVVGSILAGVAADRWGSKKVIFISYLLAGISIALLSVKVPMLIIYGLVGIAGFGTIGTTLILNAYISKYFDAEIRATAIGWALGFGRIGAILGPILIGLFMSWNFDLSTNFFVFAFAGIVAALSILCIPKNKKGGI